MSRKQLKKQLGSYSKSCLIRCQVHLLGIFLIQSTCKFQLCFSLIYKCCNALSKVKNLPQHLSDPLPQTKSLFIFS